MAKHVSAAWFHEYYPPVQIPKLAHMRDTRGQIARDIDTLLSRGIPRTNGDLHVVKKPWIITGPKTQPFARAIFRHSELFKDLPMTVLDHAPEGAGFKQGFSHKIDELVRHVTKEGHDFLIYVGAQNIADTAKAVAFNARILTGGVITAISSDGLFSDTASLIDERGMPQSFPTIAPYFVLAHRHTLARSPSNMKAACVADILTNYSALWDYDYSCRHLDLSPSDIAVHFSRSAAELVNPASFTHPLDLVNPDVIENLFRATELCGMSMQLNWGPDGRPNSATCSGSEHIIEKKIRQFIATTNNKRTREGQGQLIPPRLHGEILAPCLLLTLVLQGDTARMTEIREMFRRLKLPTKVRELNLSDEDFRDCVVSARCARAKAFEAIEQGKDPQSDPKHDRLTVLENIEKDTLPLAVENAMNLSEIGFTGS